MSVDITRIGLARDNSGAPGPGVREYLEERRIIDLFERNIISRAEARTALGLPLNAGEPGE